MRRKKSFSGQVFMEHETWLLNYCPRPLRVHEDMDSLAPWIPPKHQISRITLSSHRLKWTWSLLETTQNEDTQALVIMHLHDKSLSFHISLGSRKERNCLSYRPHLRSTSKYNLTHTKNWWANSPYKLLQQFTFTFHSAEMANLPSSLSRVRACSQAVPAKIVTHTPEMSFVHCLKWRLALPCLALISLLTHPTEALPGPSLWSVS